jgi:hypothetical protein
MDAQLFLNDFKVLCKKHNLDYAFLLYEHPETGKQELIHSPNPHALVELYIWMRKELEKINHILEPKTFVIDQMTKRIENRRNQLANHKQDDL